MAIRFKKGAPRRPHFMARWREHRGITRERMAELLSDRTVGSGITRESLWRIETGRNPYTQDLVEAYGDLLGCAPADLISRDPSDQETLLSIWDDLRNEDRPKALSIVRALGEGSNEEPKK